MEISKYWESIDLLEETFKQRSKEKNYVFYDGPPTANGQPGIHHVISRTLKDMQCRFKTMQGYYVRKKAGWDTHGLPVEIGVEQELGLTSKKEIEEYGVEAFNKKCKESVFKYEKMWREMSERMAYNVDMDDPYITLDNDYIESVWWILDQLFEKGFIYEGAKILPYCSRCGTGLASHEVAQGYEMIKTDTVTVAFKRKDADEYFLAWTTTPWTLPSNVGLTVHPDVDYVLVESHGNKFYAAKELAPSLFGEDYQVLKTLKGKDMEYMEYEQLLPFLKVDKKAFFVTVADYVTTESGTGIVHTAPSFGEEDYQTGRRYNLPLLNPVNDEGKFIDTPWKGKFVMDADLDIIKYLKEHGLLFSKQKVEHNYPHCWRCDTPLIYYSKPSWYIEVTKVKDQLIENNNGVNWYPEHIGEGRFGNWLENLKDWAISRSRYWGTPFNVWKCEDCNSLTSVGSRAELKERAIEEISEDIELHRPYVDDVHLTCPDCGGKMTREPDVIDVWFDSGAMPFAQHHYPFENKENFDEVFPADFINEGIDQTRGWFYSLLAISTMITGKSSFKNVLVNDLILDKGGKKMSKSRGNTLDPIALFDENGADVVRFYSLAVSPPWIPTRFDVDGLKEVQSKFFRSFRNTYNFFQMYSEIDGTDPRDYFVEYEDRALIDRWILSKFNTLVKEYVENMEIFEVTKVVRDIQDFVVEDLSNWYIRRNRERFWKKEVDEDKKSVYNTTYEILLGVTKLIAPFTPFIAEEFYRNLTDGISVHVDYLPEVNESLINEDLEETMELARTLVTLGRASREKANIKVRQPLENIIVADQYQEQIQDFIPLIKEELNVKNVEFAKDISQYMNFELKPNFKEVGRVLGSKIKSFQKYLNTVDEKEFIDDLKNKITIELDGEEVEIDESYVEIKVTAKEGFDVEDSNGVFVILDTVLTDDLLREGYAREFISKAQQLRKNSGFDVLDHITIEYKSTEVLVDAVNFYMDKIKEELLAEEIVFVEDLAGETVELNEQETVIEVKRIHG